MPINTESLNSRLYDLLRTRGYNPVPMNSRGEKEQVSQDADVFRFNFIKNGEDYGEVWVTVDNAENLVVYYDDDVANSPGENTSGTEYPDTWTGLLNHLKNWAKRRQLSFELKNKDRLANDMAQREYTKKKESIREGKFTVNAKTGAKLDPRTGEPLPAPVKAPAAAKQPKLTYDMVWRKVEDVVSQIFPDGDPIDYMIPWFKQYGITDFKVGEIIDKAAKKNGYEDMYDYWDSMKKEYGDQGLAEGADVEYVVVIRDEQGKRSIRVSALTPTDAKEKAEAQGYKVLKVKDPREANYFREQGVAEGSDYTEPRLGTIKANLMNTTEPTVQVQVFKHNTLRGDNYWVTKEVRKFKTIDLAKAYIDRINKQGVAEGYEETEETAVINMFEKLVKQGRDPVDMIAHKFGWGSYELDQLAKNLGFKNSAEWARAATQGKGVTEGVSEGMMKDIKRLATGKDVKSRAGQEITKAQLARAHGDNKTAYKHMKRYDKLEKLVHPDEPGWVTPMGGIAHRKDVLNKKDQDVAEGLNEFAIDNFDGDDDGAQKFHVYHKTKQDRMGGPDYDFIKSFSDKASAVAFAKAYNMRNGFKRGGFHQAVVRTSHPNEDMAESDISGLLAASRLNRSFIITANLAEGGTKKFRVKAQSERVAVEKFKQHYSMAEIVDVKEETSEGTDKEGSNMKKIDEGYYPMGKQASYNDTVPTVKIILQHTRQIQEGEQRYRNVARIFLENTQGERILAPTNRPGIAQVYARHLAEGGMVNDERWNHIKAMCEEYSKMAGFVRATRNGQFNEATQRLISEGINHYQSLRETLGKMRGHRGYNAYFENWTPPLMEDDTDTSNLNELFVQETIDPRIESVMPILSKLQKNLGEMKEVQDLEEWASGLIEDEGRAAVNPVGIPENVVDTVKKGVKKLKRGMQGWGAFDKDTPKELVKRNQAYDDDTVKLLSKTGKTTPHSPADLQKRVLDREMKKRGLGEGVGEDLVYVSVDRAEAFEDWMDSEGLSTNVPKEDHGTYVIYDFSDADHTAKMYADQWNEKRSQLDELSPETLKSYHAKAVDQLTKGNVPLKKFDKREAGAIKAFKKAYDQQDVAEDLSPEQKAAGQLGPTEKVGPKGAVGKLVGANESVERDELAELKKLLGK